MVDPITGIVLVGGAAFAAHQAGVLDSKFVKKFKKAIKKSQSTLEQEASKYDDITPTMGAGPARIK